MFSVRCMPGIRLQVCHGRTSVATLTIFSSFLPQDGLMDSRNVPTCLLSRNLSSPLSVNVDNQTVPQCADVNSVISLDQLSPDTRRHLSGPFTGGGGGSNLVSPTRCAMPFEGFDYDVGESAACLLQVGPDLLGGLLDRNTV
ncbi:hypothetical protein EAI_09729 [Harpegnathos saltator]|uniref:Uncharacterized protein n=1 Tax=Harpegnathos saltator TaxID=610380 RepID=E2C8J7_HARSA|nr:hypothetical protein EAI_09729 [Harpegnathos saltator]